MLPPPSPRALKDAVYAELARVGKALASPVRLELLDLLAQAPRPVEALAQEIGATVANTSQHLQVLKSARLVEADRRGQQLHYRLADEAVATLGVELRRLGEARLAEIEQVRRAFHAEGEGIEPVTWDALAARIARDDVALLDVRPHLEFVAGHLPGARSIPLPELVARLAELPRDRTIIAYCRGPWCVLAVEAVRLLRGAGFDAAPFDEGVADWRARGMAVACGA